MIDVMVGSSLWDQEPDAHEVVRRAIAAAAAHGSGEVAVLLTDDATIRDLNLSWRGIDRPTNVLSFPSDKRAAMLGDIAIAFETVAREAARDERPFAHHLAHLAVHGYLHLLGYDHEENAAADEMEDLERAILARLGVPDPYGAQQEEPARHA